MYKYVKINKYLGVIFLSQNTLAKGAMWGTLAVFLSKVLGFIYLIPFNKFLEVNEQIVFTSAYRIYAYVLLIATAGIPFATASMIAQYNSKHNYAVSFKLLRSNIAMMIGIGLVCALALIIFAPSFARAIITQNATDEVIGNVTTSIRIISSALIFVPMVSVVRGFFQGYKEIQVSSLSQLVEQFINSMFIFSALLLAGNGVIPNLNAVFFAVLCATLGSIASLLYLFIKYRKMNDIFEQYYQHGQALHTNVDIPTKELYKELFKISVPFVLVVLLGQSNDLIDLFFTIRGLLANGFTLEAAKEFSTIYGMSVIKLLTIPMTISTGLSVALVPHLSEAYALKDGKRIQHLIMQIINGTIVVLVPIVVLMLATDYETFYVISGGRNAEFGAHIFKYFAVYAIIHTFSIIMDNMMLSLSQRSRALVFIAVATLFKLSFTYLLISRLGILGLALSSITAALLTIIPNMYVLKKLFRLDYKPFFHNLFITMGASAIMYIVIYFLADVFTFERYIATFMETGVLYVLGIMLYIFIALKLKLIPEEIEHRFVSKFKGMIKRD